MAHIVAMQALELILFHRALLSSMQGEGFGSTLRSPEVNPVRLRQERVVGAALSSQEMAGLETSMELANLNGLSPPL